MQLLRFRSAPYCDPSHWSINFVDSNSDDVLDDCIFSGAEMLMLNGCVGLWRREETWATKRKAIEANIESEDIIRTYLVY